MRVDTGVEQGDEITSFYDPMIAKLVVWDETRERALGQMARALPRFQVAGVSTNVDFLRRLISTESFRNGMLDTGLIEHEKNTLLQSTASAPREACLLAALAALLRERSTGPSCSPWEIRDGWRLSGSLQRRIEFLQNEPVCTIEIEYLGSGFQMRLGESLFQVEGNLEADDRLTAIIDGVRMQAAVVAAHDVHYLFFDNETYLFRLLDPLASGIDEEATESGLVSPMPGYITALLVKPGANVDKGTPLLVMEAMKMEYTIRAPAAGKVDTFFFAVGEQAPERVPLLRFERDLNAGSSE